MPTHATTEKSRSTALLNTAKKGAPPFFPPVMVQPKLAIGAADDPYEREADVMSDKVMRMTNEEVVHNTPAPATVQRKCAACEKEEKGALQLKPVPLISVQRKCAACEEEEHAIHRKEAAICSPVVISPAVHQTLQSAGHPLDTGTRTFMETRFGRDFSNVQVHTNSLARQSSADINARAYTHGRHIVFGEGQYQPYTSAGKQLLAHELTHVVQQGAAGGALAESRMPKRPVLSVPVNLQRKDQATEDADAGNDPPACPKVPTNEGKQTPVPSCPTATHIGAKEVARFNFCADSKQLTNPKQLDEIAGILKNSRGSTHFLVHGYASIEGDPAYNFRLACHRANVIGTALADGLLSGMTQLSKTQADAEIASRVETASQGPTSEFAGGLPGNRVVVVYAQIPGGKAPDEPACKDAPTHLGDIRPEEPCDTPTVKLIDRDGSEQLRHFFFCADSDVLVGEGVDAVKHFAYKQAAGAVFVVHGFASEEGNADYNKRLSCNRALRITRELMNAGVRADQIREVSGLGATTHFDEREMNRTVIVLAENGKIDLLKDGARTADTPEQKNAIITEALDRLNAGQYRLEADAYISFWTCGRTKTVRDAVKRLRILLPEGNKDELIRDRANGSEEGIGVNTVRLSNTALHADNPVECVIGRLIDMAFHHAVVEDAGLSPDLANLSNPEPRHQAGLHLVALAGFDACTGRHASAGEVPGRALTGIDEPLSADPRAKIPPPLCAEAPQPTRLLPPAKGEKDREKPEFHPLEKNYTPQSGKLSPDIVSDENGRLFFTKTAGNVIDAAAKVSLTGKPEVFADYEVGFIQAILDDLTMAEYSSGHIAVQRLPVPVRAAGMKNDTPVPAPWMALTAVARPDAKGEVSLKSGWKLHTDTALLLNFFRKDLPGPDLLDTWNRHTTVALWLVARRLGAPLDRFSLTFIDGCVYDVTQNFNVDIRRRHGKLELDEEFILGESEKFAGLGDFAASKTSEVAADSRLAQLGNPVAGDIDLRRQLEKILEPAAATEQDGMTITEYKDTVQQILDTLVVFDSDEDIKSGANGQVMPRLGFVFSPLTIHISIDRRTGRMIPSLGDTGNNSAAIESVSMGKRALFHLTKALILRLDKRDFLQQARGAVLKPSAIPGTNPVSTITFSLPPLMQEKDLSKDNSVLHDMAELWACSELTKKGVDIREFAIVYWMDRDQNLHRIPEDGIIIGEPDDLSGTLTTNIPCGPDLHQVGFGMGHVHTHPVDDENAPLPSDVDQDLVKDGKCGNKFYIVSENFLVAYFSNGKPKEVGKRSSLLPGNVKCDPSRWREVKK